MKTCDQRIAAALFRASRRYMNDFYFIDPSGARIQFRAVKRDADDADVGALSGNVSARLYEFIVSRETSAFLLGNVAPLERAKKSQIVEKTNDGENWYAFVPSRPFLENTPSGGSVRFFVFQKSPAPDRRRTETNKTPTTEQGTETDGKNDD